MRAPRRLAISRIDQLQALTSPARQEILDALARMDATSLAELGAVLGRPADGLYYHVRVLQRVGLVLAAGKRKRGGREEALVRAAAPEFVLSYAATTRDHARAVSDTIASMMRLGIRDFRRALGNEVNVVEGPRRDLWALRTTAWLAPAQVAEVNTRIRELAQSVSGSRSKGRLYAITVLLTPLDHRTRKRAAARSKKA